MTKSTLARLLEETGEMTHAQLARKTELSEHTIWRLVNGFSSSTQPRTARKVLAGLNERRKELHLNPLTLQDLGLTLREAETD